jgi:hypothetical protein
MIGRTIRTAALAVAVIGGVAAAHGADAHSLHPKLSTEPGSTCCPNRLHPAISRALQTDGIDWSPVELGKGHPGILPMGMKFP